MADGGVIFVTLLLPRYLLVVTLKDYYLRNMQME
jgi:hypothetical protein